MLPITVAGAVTAAREADARTRALQARYAQTARTAEPQRPVLPPEPRRRLRWRRRPVIRPA